MKKIFIPLIVAIFLLPAAAYAQWYIKAAAGQYDLDAPGWDEAAIISTGGGFKFNDVIALEASYVYFAETEFENNPYYSLEGGLIDIGLVGTIPLSRKFEIFGRVGYGYWAADVNDYGYNSDDTGDAWNYGGGVAFNINRNFTLFAGYQKYEFDIDYSGDLKADTVYAGLKFYFDFGGGSEAKTPQSSAAAYTPQPTTVTAPKLQAVDASKRSNCVFLETVTTGAGGPGDPSLHSENAMKKALVTAANAGADSYYVVDTETTAMGASVVLEALKCN
jgi:opacity protein-like surface antigen